MNEKLSIRNFGPIKEFDIELKRVNILIGEHSTGKSTVAKLLAIFRDSEFLLQSKDPKYFENYGIGDFFHANTFLRYDCDTYTVEHSRSGLFYKSKFEIQINQTEPIKEYFENLNKEESINPLYIIRFQYEIGEGIYIPAERILGSSSGNIYLSWIASADLANYLRRFVGRLVRIKDDNKNQSIPFDVLGISYINDENGEYIYKERIDKRISIANASSGIQSGIPLLLILRQHRNTESKRRLTLIEEPELNLFPETQHLLLKSIVKDVNRFPMLENKILITTHSPYILSSINNLMYAYNTSRIDSKKTNEIVDSFSWINPADVSAFKMNRDGTSEDLIDKDLNLLKIEMIDNASKIINEEYHKLSLIEFPRK